MRNISTCENYKIFLMVKMPHNIHKVAELNLLAEMANLAETAKLNKMHKPN